MTLTPGTLFAGRYRIGEKLGAGGMAEVYKAEDSVLGRTVAIKILYPQYAKDESFVERFRREAQAAANLNQPNIVSIFDYGLGDGANFIVMEYLEGKTLKELIQEEGRLAPGRAAELAVQVLAALKAAHEAGVVHRDIKPHNIILVGNGKPGQERVKVTDFGIARTETASSVTQTGLVLGTAHYIAPEQARGSEADARADLYSAGVVLFEMLTGRVPFDAPNPVSVAIKHMSETPPSPHELEPSVPEDISLIVLKSLAKYPAERYQTAAEFAEELDRFLGGRKPAVTPAEAMTVVLPAHRDTIPGAGPAGTGVTRTGASGAAESGTADAAPGAADAGRATRGGGATSRGRHPAGPRRSRRWLWVAVAVAVVLAAGAGAYALTGLAPAQVGVPRVTGLTTKEAAAKLKQRDLKLRLAGTEYSDTVDKGKVTRQSPDSGLKVAAGTTVRIWVSRGKELVTVPDVVGKRDIEAINLLGEAGLKNAVVEEFNADVEAGVVFAQDPAAGAKAEKSSVVTIKVSKGAEKTDVPDVIGKTADEAATLLGQAGLTIKKADEASSTVDAGKVIRTSPGPGTSVNKGSTVTVYVSTGPEMVTVPDVKGLTIAAATTKLEALGLRVRVDGPPGATKVGDQFPEPGVRVEKDTEVRLFAVP